MDNAIPTTISRYEVTCTVCSSTIRPGERMFCSSAAANTTVSWGHSSCHHPNLPPPPSCRHWKQLGRCPALEAGMCAFLHLSTDKGTAVTLDKTRWGGKRHFTRNQHKNSVMRIFLMQTYGMDYLTQGSIMDVAGGKGELSWELLNLTGVRECWVVDPRPMNLELVRTKWRKGLFEPTRTGPVFGKWYPACEAGCKDRESRSPRHLRCFFRSGEFTDFVNADGGKAEASSNEWLEKEIQRAKSIAWTTKGLLQQQHEDGTNYCNNEISLSSDHESSNTVHNDAYSTEETDPRIIRQMLRNCNLILGLHPDQAAGDILEYGLANNIPYCIVPCCVYSQTFTKRKLKDGTKVTTYDELIDWLCEMDERAVVATLDVEGKNKVVYSLPR